MPYRTIARRTAQLVAVGASALALMLSAGPTQAHPTNIPFPRFDQFARFDLIADKAGHAALTDPALVNPWGLALGPTSALWVANNGTSPATATVYSGGKGTIAKRPLTVTVTGGSPTGQVFNDTTQFVVTGPGGSGPAIFLFCGQNGDISGWNPTASPTAAVVKAHVDGAVYTGMTLWHSPFGVFLLATDFRHARIDVFDAQFHRLNLPTAFFADRQLPNGYAPFNIEAIGDRVVVTYAKRSPGGDDEVAGPGFGFVDEYSAMGTVGRRIASHGTLNAPWGIAVAPASFGRFAGALLVGNFGDGRIAAYRDGRFLGLLRGGDGRPLAIDGLWDLLVGTATTGGTDAVWFSAGPQDETHGLVGLIRPAH